MTRLLNGQAVNVGLASTRVTAMRGSMRRMKRAHVAPPNPPPTTTTRPPAPWAMAGIGSTAAEAPATAVLRKSRRLVRCAVMIGLLPQSFCAPYQAAMALTSSSEKPLAMRPITVEGSCPDLNASIAVTMSAGLRPLSLGTVVSAARVAAGQPEQERAPGGASAGPAAAAQSINAKTRAAATTMRVASMSEPPEMLLRADRGRAFSGFYALLKSWFLSGRERMRLPAAAKMALHKAGASGGTGVSPAPPQKPSLGTMTVSTRGMSARRSIG